MVIVRGGDCAINGCKAEVVYHITTSSYYMKAMLHAAAAAVVKLRRDVRRISEWYGSYYLVNITTQKRLPHQLYQLMGGC